MLKKTAIAAGALALGLVASAASAAPVSGARDNPAAGEGIVEQAQGYRYRRDCVWVNGDWRYGRPGAYVSCRPYRPIGPGWTWYSEGGRHGWYHQRRKTWHHNKW